MKLWIVGFAAILGSAGARQGGQPATQPGQQVLTLDQAISIAEKNAFSIRTAASNVEKARQRVNEARGALGPRVTGTGSYTRFTEPQGFSLGSSASGGGTGSTGGTTGGSTGQVLGSGAIDTKQAGLSLQLPIDISGTTHKQIRAQEFFYRGSQESLNVTRNDLRLNVKNAYFQVLQAEAQIAVAQQAVADAQSQLKNAQKQLAAGVIARFDVLRFETQLSQAQSNVITAQNALQVAKENFNNVLARPIETPFEVAPVDTLPQVGASPDALVGTAVANRPELRQLRDQLEGLRNVTRATEAGMDPSLSLSATHARVFTNGFTSQGTTYGSLLVNVPIFDSGVTRARVRAARQDEAQVQIGLEQQQLGISLEVRQALTNLINARSRLDVAQKQVEQAQEAYRLAVVRYQAGEGIQLDVTDAQTSLTTAQTGVVNARYDYLRAYAALQRAMGTEDVNGAAPAAPGGK